MLEPRDHARAIASSPAPGASTRARRGRGGTDPQAIATRPRGPRRAATSTGALSKTRSTSTRDRVAHGTAGRRTAARRDAQADGDQARRCRVRGSAVTRSRTRSAGATARPRAIAVTAAETPPGSLFPQGPSPDGAEVASASGTPRGKVAIVTEPARDRAATARRSRGGRAVGGRGRGKDAAVAVAVRYRRRCEASR